MVNIIQNIQVGFISQEFADKYAEFNKDKDYKEITSEDLLKLINTALSDANNKVIALYKFNVKQSFTLNAPSNNINFDLGDCKFNGKVTLAGTFQGSFNCNNGVFLADDKTDVSTSFTCSDAVFKQEFKCGVASFNIFRCGNAIFEDDFDCGNASFLKYFYGETATFKKLFKWRNATFYKMSNTLNLSVEYAMFVIATQKPHKMINIISYMGQGLEQLNFAKALDMGRENNEIVYIQTKDGNYIPRDVYLGIDPKVSLLDYKPLTFINITKDTSRITITSKSFVNEEFENCLLFTGPKDNNIQPIAKTAFDMVNIFTESIYSRSLDVKTLDIIFNFDGSATAAPLNSKTLSFIEKFIYKILAEAWQPIASKITLSVEGRAGKINNENDVLYYNTMAPFDFDVVIDKIKQSNYGDSSANQDDVKGYYAIVYKFFTYFLNDSYLIVDKNITQDRYKTLITDTVLDALKFTDTEKQIITSKKDTFALILSTVLLDNKKYCNSNTYYLAPTITHYHDVKGNTPSGFNAAYGTGAQGTVVTPPSADEEAAVNPPSADDIQDITNIQSSRYWVSDDRLINYMAKIPYTNTLVSFKKQVLHYATRIKSLRMSPNPDAESEIAIKYIQIVEQCSKFQLMFLSKEESEAIKRLYFTAHDNASAILNPGSKKIWHFSQGRFLQAGQYFRFRLLKDTLFDVDTVWASSIGGVCAVLTEAFLILEGNKVGSGKDLFNSVFLLEAVQSGKVRKATDPAMFKQLNDFTYNLVLNIYRRYYDGQDISYNLLNRRSGKRYYKESDIRRAIRDHMNKPNSSKLYEITLLNKSDTTRHAVAFLHNGIDTIGFDPNYGTFTSLNDLLRFCSIGYQFDGLHACNSYDPTAPDSDAYQAFGKKIMNIMNEMYAQNYVNQAITLLNTYDPIAFDKLYRKIQVQGTNQAQFVVDPNKQTLALKVQKGFNVDPLMKSLLNRDPKNTITIDCSNQQPGHFILGEYNIIEARTKATLNRQNIEIIVIKNPVQSQDDTFGGFDLKELNNKFTALFRRLEIKQNIVKEVNVICVGYVANKKYDTDTEYAKGINEITKRILDNVKTKFNSSTSIKLTFQQYLTQELQTGERLVWNSQANSFLKSPISLSRVDLNKISFALDGKKLKVSKVTALEAQHIADNVFNSIIRWDNQIQNILQSEITDVVTSIADLLETAVNPQENTALESTLSREQMVARNLLATESLNPELVATELKLKNANNLTDDAILTLDGASCS